MATSILIVGLGDFGSRLAKEFTRLGYDVLGVDMNEERVRELSDIVSKVVQGDSTSPGLWRDLPTNQVDIGVIAFSSSIAANLQTALLLKKSGIKMLIAKSQGELHTELLNAIGANRVIDPDKESALLTIHILDSDIEDYMEVTREFGVARIKASNLLGGMTMGSLFEKHKTTVAILRRGDRVLLEPPDTEEINPGDTLIVAGTDEDLRSIPGVGRPHSKDEQVV